jgi:hypothetical protein
LARGAGQQQLADDLIMRNSWPSGNHDDCRANGLMALQAHAQTGGQPPMPAGDIATAAVKGLPAGT